MEGGLINPLALIRTGAAKGVTSLGLFAIYISHKLCTLFSLREAYD